MAKRKKPTFMHDKNIDFKAYNLWKGLCVQYPTCFIYICLKIALYTFYIKQEGKNKDKGYIFTINKTTAYILYII